MLYNYNSFLNERKNTETVNEGLFGFLKKMFNKVAEYGKKMKESGEIDYIIADAIKKADGLLKEKENDIGDAPQSEDVQGDETPPTDEKIEDNITTDETKEPTDEIVQQEKVSYKYKLNEADDTKVEEPKNPIDKALSELLNNTKEKCKKYLQSDVKGVKFYMANKLSELNDHILMGDIEIYKKTKGKEKEVAAKEKQLEESKKKAEESFKELEKIFGSDEDGDINKFEPGDIYRYTTSEGDENLIMFVTDKDVKTLRKGNKPEGKLDVDNFKNADTFIFLPNGLGDKYDDADGNFTEQKKTTEETDDKEDNVI